MHADPDAALDRIVERYHRVAEKCDAVVIVGSDYTDVGTPTEFSYNARIAANLGAPVLLVLNGSGRTPADLHTVTDMAAGELAANHGTLFAIIANRVDAAEVRRTSRRCRAGDVPAYAIPEQPLLSAPSLARPDVGVRRARWSAATRPCSTARPPALVVAAMTMPNVLDRLFDGAVVITPGTGPRSCSAC